MDKIEAVIFDMDGLMVDSERLWIDSVLKVAEECGYCISEEFLISLSGMRKEMYDKELQKYMGDDFDIVSFRKKAEALLEKQEDEGKMGVKKGLKDLLKFFKERGLKLAVASSSDIEEVKRRLHLAGVDLNFFSSITGGDMIARPKPDPQIYLKSCENLGVSPENAIALEDSDYGIESAYRAGLKAIHIPDMKEPSENSKRFAYKRLNDLSEVQELFA